MRVNRKESSIIIGLLNILIMQTGSILFCYFAILWFCSYSRLGKTNQMDNKYINDDMQWRAATNKIHACAAELSGKYKQPSTPTMGKSYLWSIQTARSAPKMSK